MNDHISRFFVNILAIYEKNSSLLVAYVVNYKY